MEGAGLFLTAFVVALTGAMMPGPLLTVTVAESVRDGPRAGPLLVAGHGVLEAVLVVALALGLGPFISRQGVVAGIALLGGGFLLWMGVTIVGNALAGRITLDIKAEKKAPPRPAAGAGRLVGLGAAVSISNPYWSLWWATIGLSYVNVALNRGWEGVTVFYAGHILADLAWYAAVAVAVAGGRRFLTPALYRGILAVAGLFLIGLAGYFILRGVAVIGLP
uniref:Lysine transporter LysE n=1 Tax=Ammonifex degensii TaxID=42838 RepID=A0A7C2IVS7_9THEO